MLRTLWFLRYRMLQQPSQPEAYLLAFRTILTRLRRVVDLVDTPDVGLVITTPTGQATGLLARALDQARSTFCDVRVISDVHAAAHCQWHSLLSDDQYFGNNDEFSLSRIVLAMGGMYVSAGWVEFNRQGVKVHRLVTMEPKEAEPLAALGAVVALMRVLSEKVGCTTLSTFSYLQVLELVPVQRVWRDLFLMTEKLLIHIVRDHDVGVIRFDNQQRRVLSKLPNSTVVALEDDEDNSQDGLPQLQPIDFIQLILPRLIRALDGLLNRLMPSGLPADTGVLLTGIWPNALLSHIDSFKGYFTSRGMNAKGLEDTVSGESVGAAMLMSAQNQT